MHDVRVEHAHGKLLSQAGILLLKLFPWDLVFQGFQKVKEPSTGSVELNGFLESPRFPHVGSLTIPVFGHSVNHKAHLGETVHVEEKLIGLKLKEQGQNINQT